MAVDDLKYVITVSELNTRLGVTLSTALGEQACAIATAAISAYTGQDIVWKTHTHSLDVQYGVLPDVDLPAGHPLLNFGRTVGVVNLPQRPVVSVSAVVADTVDLATSKFYWDAARGVLLLEDADVHTVQVTYTAGYNPIPDDIKAVALAIAADEINNPRGVVNERLADYSVTYASGESGALSKRQAAILDRYRGAGGTIRTVQ